MRASSRSAAAVRGCPLRRPRSSCLPPQQLEVRVGAVVSRNGAADAAAQGLDLCCRRTRCIRHRRCFRLRSGCCQLHRCQPRHPCRRRSGLCRRSLAFLCRGKFGLLPTLRARGDRALRLPCGHDALPGDCCVGRGLLQTSSAQRERSEQERPELLLLPAGAVARLEKEMSRRYSGYMIVRL